jgi:hypothetical protein
MRGSLLQCSYVSPGVIVGPLVPQTQRNVLSNMSPQPELGANAGYSCGYRHGGVVA